MRRVVIESPYGNADPGIVQDNIHYARHCLRHSLDLGEAPIASHLLYTQPFVLDDRLPKDREHGIQAGLEWMEVADAVCFYMDRGWSRGMVGALKAARMLKKHAEVRSLHHNRFIEVPMWEDFKV